MIDCLCMVPCLNGHCGVLVTPTTQYANKDLVKRLVGVVILMIF